MGSPAHGSFGIDADVTSFENGDKYLIGTQKDSELMPFLLEKLPLTKAV